MQKIENLIVCEIVNDFGVLVEQKIKMCTEYIPAIGDKFEFRFRGHFRPVVVEITEMSSGQSTNTNWITQCIGQELDGEERVRERFAFDTFSVTW